MSSLFASPDVSCDNHICSVAKLWAVFPYDHATFVDMALKSFTHTFPDQSPEFIGDFKAALSKGIEKKSGGDLRTCVNVAIASTEK